jgi:heme/copper-type cytochrome/quinol oxidase subunit 3
MATQEIAATPSPQHHTSMGLDNNKMGMWAFIGSECLFFGALIATFLLYRTTAVDGPIPHDLYDIPFTSVSAFVLLMSSLTMVLAVNAFHSADHRQGRIWLLATAFLGMVFLGGQVFEFTHFYEHGLTLTSNPAASSFFVLTGFHGAHVTIGVLMLLSLVGLTLVGRLGTDDKGARTVEIIGLYWHFVDIVWVVIFTVVYLVPVD